MALLDSKAGQEDVSSINRAMGDVKESLAIVTGSLPGDTGKVLTTLQVVAPMQFCSNNACTVGDVSDIKNTVIPAFWTRMLR